MTAALDPRLNAYRDDLADARLEGRVVAPRFVAGTPRRVVTASTPLRKRPESNAPLDSELLRGERVTVFDETAEGWSWVQNATEGYVGYVASDALAPLGPEPTHRVAALRSFVYPGPDLKFPHLAALSLGSAVTVTGTAETRGTSYALLAGGEGATIARHLVPVTAPPEPDFVAVAERFLNVPYLWGGRTSLGLDCSALVQLSLMSAGVSAPRDTDMQRAGLGVEAALPLVRGDLAFWPGHVAIAVDRERIVHASGHHMTVVEERLADAVARIGQPATIRRIVGGGAQ